MALKPDKEYKIRSRYRPSKENKDALRYVYDRFQDMKEGRSTYENEWEKAQKQYEGFIASQDREDWQSDIYIPLTSSIVEAILAEIIDLNLRPLYLPREPQDQSAATVLNHIFKYTWEIGDGDIEQHKVLKDMLIFGTGIAQEYWRSDPRTVKEMVSFDPDAGEEYKEREIKDFDDVYMEAVRLHDFYIDERARGFVGPNGARDCIRRYVMHIDDFKNYFKGSVWDHLGAAKYVVPGGDTNYYEFYSPPEGIDKNEVEVLWYWNKPDDRLVIVANDVVVRNTPNPYTHKRLPFARAVDIFDGHKFYGTGEPKLLEGLQEEMNIHRRMLMDRGHLDIDKMFLVSSRESLDEEQLIKRPHGIIEVDDPNSMVPIEYGDVPSSYFQSLEMMRDDAVRVTGFDDRMQSVKTPGTATEAAILKESSLRRIRAKVFLLGKMFLVNIGRLRLANIQQFYSTPKIEKIIGDKESRKYREAVADAKRHGRYRSVNGDDYEEKYRTIRIEDKELERGDNGEIVESPHSGWTFFEADPDSIRGNLDISITSGPILPVSKPLLQQRTETLAQHPVIMAGVEAGIYDPAKIGDALLKAHDFSPDDFKTQEQLPEQQEVASGPSDMEREIELASIENEQMMKGKAIAPTPYVSSKHTKLHLAFMESEDFKSLPNDSPVIQNMTNHVAGELEAQRRRGEEVPREPGDRQTSKPPGAFQKAVGAVKGFFGGPKPVEQAMATTPAKAIGSENVQKIV